MRELRSWGVFLLPNTDFFPVILQGFHEADADGQQVRFRADWRGVWLGGHCFWPLQKQIVHGEDNKSKGSCTAHLPRDCRFDLPGASCSAHHLQALYASATQQTPSAPFNDFCLMNFSVFIKGDAVTGDSLKHTHPYNLYQAPSHNHSGSAPNIAQALQNWGFTGSRLLILS